MRKSIKNRYLADSSINVILVDFQLSSPPSQLKSIPRVLKRLLQSFAQRARATCAQWISKQQFTKHTEMLQSTPTAPRNVGHHASLLLRLPSAKECGGAFHKKCLQNSMQNSKLGKMQSIYGTGVTHGRDHGNPTTKRLPSIDTRLTSFTRNKEP